MGILFEQYGIERLYLLKQGDSHGDSPTAVMFWQQLTSVDIS